MILLAYGTGMVSSIAFVKISNQDPKVQVNFYLVDEQTVCPARGVFVVRWVNCIDPSIPSPSTADSKMARRTLKCFDHFFKIACCYFFKTKSQQKMATVGTNRGEHEEPGAKSRPCA